MRFLDWLMGVNRKDSCVGQIHGLFCGRLGAYAEYISVSTHMLIHKPDHLSWEEAAGVPEVNALHQLALIWRVRADRN